MLVLLLAATCVYQQLQINNNTEKLDKVGEILTKSLDIQKTHESKINANTDVLEKHNEFMITLTEYIKGLR